MYSTPVMVICKEKSKCTLGVNTNYSNTDF